MKTSLIAFYCSILCFSFLLSSGHEVQASSPQQDPTSRKDEMTLFIPLLYLVRPAMVQVPAGEFQMGCDSTHEVCREGNQFLHPVYLDTFWIYKHEVTNAQYGYCVAAGACQPPSSTASNNHPFYFGNPAYNDYPVIYVSWSQAQDYCQWDGKRLPSEAEWEKAARGSSDTRTFPWGNGLSDCTLANAYNQGEATWCYGDSTEVGSYPLGASPYGAMDMTGNVWEWVNDWWQVDYYETSPTANPPGPDSGSEKVLRGGDWFTADSFTVYVSYRLHSLPDVHVLTYGFRCANSLAP